LLGGRRIWWLTGLEPFGAISRHGHANNDEAAKLKTIFGLQRTQAA
jgi:hypothetical protein